MNSPVSATLNRSTPRGSPPASFPTLGISPLMGRAFTPREDEGAQQVAVLSYQTWRSRFHGDPNVLGQKLLLDRKPYEIIGVMPRDFEFPLVPGQLNRAELWVPMSFHTNELVQGAGAWAYSLIWAGSSRALPPRRRSRTRCPRAGDHAQFPACAPQPPTSSRLFVLLKRARWCKPRRLCARCSLRVSGGGCLLPAQTRRIAAGACDSPPP